MRPVTPRGFRDVLALEAAERDALVGRMNAALSSWGYDYVETPTVELAETLEAASGTTVGSGAFRLFDSDGPMLVLRPEMTVAIARLAATRFEEADGPHRLRYSGRVFRDQPSMRGQAREFTQVGVELVGVNGPASDAEIVGLMTGALDAAGLREYTVAVGTVAVLRSLIEAAEMDDQWNAALFNAAHQRNLVRVGELADAEGVPAEVSEALCRVPGIRGGREAIDECRSVAGRWAASALDELEATWELLGSQGCDARVSIDFGIMRSFDYYTGMVLEAYGSGPGLPLGGGGRYDGVLESFDSPSPAAGFAIRVERLHQALSLQGIEIAVEPLDAVLGGSAASAFESAARLRAAGWRVRLSPGLQEEALVAAGERVGARCTLVAQDDGSVLEVGNSATSAPLDLDEPPVRDDLERGES